MKICLMTGALIAADLVAASASNQLADSAAVTHAPTCSVSDCHLSVMQHKRIHQPVMENRCDACHVPKPGATPVEAGPRHEFKRAGDNPELCYACHDRLAEDSFVHEPVKMGVCILCHDPHGSERGRLLRVDTDRQLCAQCHRVTVDRGKHVHPPVDDGTCSACHNPHGSDQRKFLHSAPPELCLDCHDTIDELLEEASVVHDAVSTDRSCLNCHDPHASEHERLLLREPMELCLSCHDRELDSKGGKIRDMAQYLKVNRNHHGPVRDGNCSACHNPHAGAVFRMLTEEYPAGPYAPYNEEGYALCFGCHDVEIVEEERDEKTTEFRNGDLNLHFVHVNRENKGTTCSNCHDAHGSEDPKYIIDPSSIRAEGIRMAYQASPTGGSCVTQCHATWAYDRVQPVRNERP